MRYLFSHFMFFRLQIPASVISSVGTVNYQQAAHQIFVVSRPNSQDGTIQHFQAAPIIISPSQHTATTHFQSTAPTSSTSLRVLNTHLTNQPRLHPKKRKFNPAELEEMEPTTVATTTSNRNGNVNDWTPEKQQTVETVYTMAPKMVVTTSTPIKEAAAQNRIQIQNQIQQAFTESVLKRGAQASLTSADSPMETLDLSEWCNQRVLAKQNEYYATGVTRSSSGGSSIAVEFDYPEGNMKVFHDVFGNGRYDVISDASPPVNEVSYSIQRKYQAVISLSIFCS